MKKLKVFTLILLGFFLCVTSVNAETLNRNSVSNGKLELSILSNHGYVGAVDATIQITGNVSLVNLIWDTSLDNLAMREYHYDNNTNTLRIILVTKNTEQNLLDPHGNLKIGTIEVTAKETTDYDAVLANLEVTNLDLVKADIQKENLLVSGDDTFTVQVANTDEPEPTPGTEEDPDNQDINGENSSDNTESDSNNQLPNTESNSNQNNQNVVDNQQKEENNINDHEESNSSTNHEQNVVDKEEDESKSNTTLYITVGVIGGIIIIGIVGWYLSKKR